MSSSNLCVHCGQWQHDSHECPSAARIDRRAARQSASGLRSVQPEPRTYNRRIAEGAALHHLSIES
jgi:hypothetical protein